jgi:hypothetical protein
MNDFLRQSQVITTFSPGSIVDLPDRAVLIMGLQSWRYGEGRDEVAEPASRRCCAASSSCPRCGW